MSPSGDFCVTVYGGSSDSVDDSFKKEAQRLGSAIAEAGFTQCNGGGAYGLMGAATDGALANGGAVDCIILRRFADYNMHRGPFRETVLLDDMPSRKKALYERGDAFISLPGGLGTLEEMAEVASWRQLELHDKPLILLNTNGFYDYFWKFFQHCMETKFASEACSKAIFIAKDTDEAMQILRDYKPEKIVKNEDIKKADWSAPAAKIPQVE